MNLEHHLHCKCKKLEHSMCSVTDIQHVTKSLTLYHIVCAVCVCACTHQPCARSINCRFLSDNYVPVTLVGTWNKCQRTHLLLTENID
jgi:hypothetical protein